MEAGLSNISFAAFGVIFHVHDDGKKGIYSHYLWTIHLDSLQSLGMATNTPRSLGFYCTKQPGRNRTIKQLYQLYNQGLFLVPLKGGRWHIIPQLAVYTTYILPSGGVI